MAETRFFRFFLILDFGFFSSGLLGIACLVRFRGLEMSICQDAIGGQGNHLIFPPERRA